MQMIISLFGFILFLVPFAAVFRFKDKAKGLFMIIAVTSGFHIISALTTQFFGIFNYKSILILNIVFVLVSTVYMYTRPLVHEKFRINLNWFVALIFLISILFSASIHYRYSGIVDSVNGLTRVSNSYYPYPLYSDEWIGVSLADYAIRSNSLPLVNPLSSTSEPFINLTVGFYSILAYLFLLFNLTPLTSYVIFAIMYGLALLACVYNILKLLGVSRTISAIMAISIFFITNSGNLPGVWHLMSYGPALLFMLIGIIGVLQKAQITLFTSFTIALIFYPPIFLFILPILLVYLYESNAKNKNRISSATYGLICFCIFLPLIIIYFLNFDNLNFKGFMSKVYSLLLRENLDGGIISFSILNIIPFYLIPFIFIGFYRATKQKVLYLIAPSIVGVLFWIIYSFVLKVIVIEPARVVVITSVFLIIFAGIGAQYIWSYISLKYPEVNDRRIRLYLKIVTLLLLLVMAYFNSYVGLWHKMVLTKETSGVDQEYIPAPPINRYLHKDDMRIFENIKQQNILTDSWKGLVIGVATHNYPINSKASTITNNIFSLNDFLTSDCKVKSNVVEKYKIKYVYSRQFNCKGFNLVDMSEEGFYLYEYGDNK